jgi:hypothetical protein
VLAENSLSQRAHHHPRSKPQTRSTRGRSPRPRRTTRRKW